MLATTATDATMGIAIHRSTLANGLRSTVAPERGTGVAAVAVHYGVGYRSEPPGLAGFAHLFEHLMFQGSANAAKLEHFRQIQASGGFCNASTYRDHTCYHQVLPAAAVRRALFLEADRMRSPRLTESSLVNQVAVIREEIGANVLGRPYGGFPWLLLPPVLFDGFANAHQGYGAVDELANATLDECTAFFDTYYGPANAVLTVTGDVDPDVIAELTGELFGDIPPRPAPPPASLAEAPLDTDRERSRTSPGAALPALAVGWRLGAADLAPAARHRLAFALLAACLCDGERARLRSRLLGAGTVTNITATAGLTGQFMQSRDPDVFVVSALLRPGPGDAAGAVVAGIDAELARLAENGPEPAELQRVAARLAATRYRRLSRLTDRAQLLGTFELLHGCAELAWDVAAQCHTVPTSAVAEAAADLLGARRGILRLMPARAGQ